VFKAKNLQVRNIHGTVKTNRLQRDTVGIGRSCRLGPVGVFIIKFSRSVKFKLNIPLYLFNLNIITKISKHPRQIKGPFSVV